MAQQRKSSDRLVMTLAGIAGLLLSLCVLLAAKIYNPSIYELMLRTSFVKEPLSDFEIETLSGEIVSNYRLKGEMYLLFFGDPECSACTGSYPVLREAQEILPVIFIGRGSRKNLTDLVEKEHFVFPVAFDSLEVISKKLGIPGLPTALFINQDGVVIRKASGSITVSAFINHIKRFYTEIQKK